MRHGKKFNHLGRTKPHREAMLANMACSLIENKRIKTTIAKAKSLRTFVEPLITKSKSDSTHSRRMVFRQLKNKHAVSELFRDVAAKVADRPGGYTRIIRTGYRLGDNAEMCMIELVDFNDLLLKEDKPKSTRRRKRKSSDTAPTATATSEAKEEVKEEAPKAKKEETPKAEVKKEKAPKKETKTEKKAEEPVSAPKAEKKPKKESDSDKKE